MNIGEAATRRLTKTTYLRVSRMSFALLALGLVASLGRAQTPTGDDVPGQLAGNTPVPRPSLDFKLHRGYLIVVSGSVSGLKNLHFLVDTAASKSIAATRLVERLGAHQHPGTLCVPGETVSVGQAVLTDLRAGPLSAKSLSVSALDLASVEQALGTHIDMLIGLDLLGQSSFSIDYETKRILFGPPPALPLMIPMQSGPPLVSVTAQLDGRPVRLLVNTSVPALSLHAPDGEATTREVNMDQANLAINVAGGWLVSERVSVQSVRLGDVELGRQPAFLVTERRKEFDGSLPIPGHFKEVAFDFEHHLLGLRR